MTCDRVRWLLSLDPRAGEQSLDPLARRHLQQCPACRSFQQALQWVETDLQARPLAQPAAGLLPSVMRGVERAPQPREFDHPFTQAFCVVSAIVTLLALAAGAVLLQNGSVAPLPGSDPVLASTWLNPVWPRDASAWLSAQNTQAAQIVLAAMAGLLVTVAGAAIGFRASAHGQ